MSGSGDQSEQVITLFSEMLRRERPERRSFIEQTCAGDQDLYRELSEMLEWEERMGGFLTDPLIQYIDFEAQEQPFEPGQLVADRFTIIRFVASGGMGVVYEAFDEKRQKRIAIKCSRPGFGPLLSPELEGALKVLHPNICRVHDTHTANTGSGKVDFLTMEFIDGESLAERLHRRGKLEPEEALEIARQLCAGVAAAHEAGILHRDLKSGNVLLARKEDGTFRAVITDFGLATEAHLDAELEGGTPRYMAPELRRGKKPSKASDVYALGVILYEMVTGEPPFEPDSHRDLKTDAKPLPPSTVNKDLRPLWDKAILPCLDSDPDGRPQTHEILAVFDRKPIWKSPVLAIAALILVSLAAAFQRPIMRFFTPAQIRLAIFPAETGNGLEQFGKGLLQQAVERIRRNQSGTGFIAILPPSTLAARGVHSPEQAHNLLRATHALVIKLSSHGDALDLHAEVLELSHDTHVRDFKARYSSLTKPDMPAVLSDAIAGALHLRNPEPYGAVSSSARADYEKGLALLDVDEQNYERAMQFFTAAAEQDPHSGLPLAGLAEAELAKCKITTEGKWMDAAAQYLQQAEALSPDSVPVLLAKGHLQVSSGQRDQALETYRRAEELAPKNVEVLLRAADAYQDQKFPDEALRFYRRAIALSPGNYKTYQKLGLFYYLQGDYGAAAEQFQKAVNLAPGRYDLHNYLAGTRAELGAFGAAEQEYAISLNIHRSGSALCGLGAVKESEGRDDEGAAFLGQSVALD
ncbi:MAG: protein kinase domain-containing protein, partial [Actinomycetota bacterium]